MNIFDLLESPGMGRPRDTKGVQSAADQSSASPIGSGTTEREEKKKPVTMMGKNIKEAVEEAVVKPNFKMPPESLQDKMYRQHQELRKQRGAPSPEEYKQRIAQKQAEIDALKESSYASDKNYKQADTYKNYNIYVGKNPFVKQSTGEKFYIAVTNIGKHEFKEKGVTPQEAVTAIQNKIDEILNAQQRVSASATLDFNVKFATDILGNPRESFYAKVINLGGEPKLVIAGKEMLDFGRELVSLGFKPSSLRIDPESEAATALPSISYSARQIKDTGLIANGRYEIGDMKTDAEGNRVFDLTYHSTAHTKSDKMRLNKPAVTVGTTRSAEVKEGILDRAAPKLPKPRNPADQVLRGKVNAAGKHLDKKRRQDLNPKHKHKDPLDEGAISNAIASAALASSMALGGVAHAGEPVVGLGQSQNMQMAVDMAKMNAKVKYMKTVYGDNFQDKQMPDYHWGKVDLKPGKDGGYQATVPLIVDSEVQESLRPGERHHFETDPETGKRVYKGIRGDQQDAPKKRDASGDAGERADRERQAHIAHDRGMTEGVAEGAPELLKAEMPLVREIERELAKHGYEKGTEEYNTMFKHQMAVHRKFGNAERMNKPGVAEGANQFGSMMSKITAPESVDASEALALIDDLMHQAGASFQEALKQASVSYNIKPNKLHALYKQRESRSAFDNMFGGGNPASNLGIKEQEQLDELSPKTLISYSSKAQQDAQDRIAQVKSGAADKHSQIKTVEKRVSGIKQAHGKVKAARGVAEDITEDIERYVEALSRAGYEINEEKTRLDPKCWKGKKIGNPKTKIKGGVRVNNCVPK